MKEDWLKDIHDRMADYEVPEPEGLWSDIERQLPTPPVARPRFSVRRRLMVWGSSVAAVAAVVALVFLLPLREHRRPACEGQLAETSKSAPLKEHRRPACEAPRHSKGFAATSLPYIYNKEELTHHALGQSAPQSENGENKEEKDLAEAPQPTTPSTSTTDASEKSSDTPRQQTKPSTSWPLPSQDLAVASPSRSAEPRFSVSVFAAGGNSASHSQSEPGYLTAEGYDDAVEEEENTPLAGIIEYNRDKEVQTTAHHRQPVRFGLNVGYQLNDRLAVETGLTYTRLSSELQSGTEGYYFTGDQRLHYVGIPFSLRARLLTLSGFDAYAAATALTELRVAGTVERGYVLDHDTWSVVREHIHSHPLQFSLGLSVGLQYRLAPAVAVYAEPGVGYYFSDGSSVSTIYKEHPFNFQLNLGLRLTVGK